MGGDGVMRYYVEWETEEWETEEWETEKSNIYVYVYADSLEQVRDIFKDYKLVCVDQTD